ncbi:deoxyribodipyrimidine photolyase-related protein [Acinetobacter kyonggiensis]|uniref:Deoxyribodipyrimidine photolyase-related protein n=1 Tax=Acinetobacter kyonggiensis TaxID=595670 RepID=A0A1H3HXX8_9GAMM|nr:deoxyribodipyrimidine photolyase-related protein [Acinetobacter kyonggiensis]
MIYGVDYLFHSVLSPYLNCGLLMAKEVCDAAEAAYYTGHAPLNSVEGLSGKFSAGGNMFGVSTG